MTNTDKLSLLNITLEFLASLWSRFWCPVTIDRTLEVNGRRVRIRVEDVEIAAEQEIREMLEETRQ